MTNRRGFLKTVTAFAATAAVLGMPQYAFAEGETIKVGVLHSLSGTMAISETTLKDVMLMLIEQQNAKGGLLGKKLTRPLIGRCLLKKPADSFPPTNAQLCLAAGHLCHANPCCQCSRN
jgi:hypothetical protein